MKKLSLFVLILILAMNIPTLTIADSSSASVPTSVQVKRIFGDNRYETAIKIADEVAQENNIDFTQGDRFNSVLLASGNNYPDALAGAPLANQVGGPILLLDSTPEASTVTWEYIRTHVKINGNVYILGGTGVIPYTFTKYLLSMGFSAENIHQIGGKDRNETSLLIAQQLANKQKNVMLVSGNNFNDALTVASAAVYENIPVLLVPESGLTPEQKSFCDLQSGGVLAIGNITTVIGDSYSKAIGIFGTNVYDTNALWVAVILKNQPKVFLATGDDYPDALAGALLAGQVNECPIIFTHKNYLDQETIKGLNWVSYYDKQNLTTKNAEGQTVVLPAVNYPELIVLGGPGAVSDNVVNQAQQILNSPGYCD